MLDTDFMRGRVHHYRHLADGTEDRESAAALLTLADAFEAEADLIERSLYRRSRIYEGRER
ncbi:MAG TPA: hypothetical protein VMU06_07950 [Stellaceae bacterium]|jgi:hypothetical protein|nr:hypothetical protein [Stellaceae bacterium]